MYHIYIEKSAAKDAVASQYVEGSSSITKIKVVGKVFGLNVYMLQEDKQRTSAFGVNKGFQGGLSSSDMQRYAEMPEVQQQALKNILHSQYKITMIISLGEEVAPGIFRLITADEKEVRSVPSVDLEKLISQSAEGGCVSHIGGIGYRLMN